MWWSYSGLIKMNQESLKWAWRYLTSSWKNGIDHFKSQELNYFLYVVFYLLVLEWKFSCSGTALATAVAQKWFILRVTAVVNLLTPTTLKRFCLTVGRSLDGTDLKLLHSEGKRIGRPPNPMTWPHGTALRQWQVLVCDDNGGNPTKSHHWSWCRTSTFWRQLKMANMNKHSLEQSSWMNRSSWSSKKKT